MHNVGGLEVLRQYRALMGVVSIREQTVTYPLRKLLFIGKLKEREEHMKIIKCHRVIRQSQVVVIKLQRAAIEELGKIM